MAPRWRCRACSTCSHRLSLTATFFVPGRVAERYPERVREIISAGHEIGHHGYTHTSPTSLTHEQEEAELTKGKAVLEALGADVVGYRSPSWDFSPHTLDLLVSHGFHYSSNLMDDIRPYRHPEHSIVELPVHWTIDDAPHFWLDAATWVNTIRTAAEVEALWHEELSRATWLPGACSCSRCTPRSSAVPVGFSCSSGSCGT